MAKKIDDYLSNISLIIWQKKLHQKIKYYFKISVNDTLNLRIDKLDNRFFFQKKICSKKLKSSVKGSNH